MSVRSGSSLQVAQQQTAQSTVFPAPLGGMDGRIAVADDDLNVCLWAINIMPTEFGMRVRNGYREWQTGMPSEVRTMIPYDGTVETGLDDKIFAVCAEGIYDVTGQGGTPILKFAFSDTSEDSGWGNYLHYNKPNGDDIMYYADGANGLFLYDPALDTWVQATGIVPNPDALNTIDVTNIVYIVSHKLRLWFIEKDKTYAWYLGVNSYTGEATEFFFGGKFKHGGDLVGLYNWTQDGGQGRDDFLVAISRGGDVMPYRGDDPSSAMTWENIGLFFIGRVARGRTCASEYGGNLFMLSALGIVSMNELVAGAEVLDPSRSQLGAKIATLVRTDMVSLSDKHGWAIKFVADQGMLTVNTPLRSTGGYRQYVMNTTTSGWGLWRDIPLVSSEPYQGDLMIGDPDGRVLRMDRTVDNVPKEGGEGTDISWVILTSYSNLGSPALNKRAKFIRPNFSVSEAKPTFDVFAFYDYFTVLPAAPIDIPQPLEGGSLWDTADWDINNWGQGATEIFFRTAGANGMGRAVAIAMSGRSRGRTTLASWDLMWDTGGFL